MTVLPWAWSPRTCSVAGSFSLGGKGGLAYYHSGHKLDYVHAIRVCAYADVSVCSQLMALISV